METTLRSHYDVIESLPASVGDFATAAYKARESNPAAPGSSLGRVVLLRLLPATANTPEVRAASDQYASLPLYANILTHIGLAESPSAPDLPAGLYAVSEWARGITLRERIKRVAPFSLAVALDIAIAATLALIHASSHGVEHGDLQAEDILLTPENHVKVADFAIGRAIRQAAGVEILSEPQTRSIARLMFEMLTGKAGPVGVEPLAPRFTNPNIPITIDGIIQKASLRSISAGYTGLSTLLADLQTAREDARMGKPLVWSPLDPQPAGSAPNAPAPGKTRPRSALAVAADEILEEQQQHTMASSTRPVRRSRREPSGDDQYDDDDYEPRPSAGAVWMRRLAMMLAGVIVLVVVFLCAYFFWLVSNVPSDITVPYLVGKPYTDAQTTAGQQHFHLIEMGHDFSDTWPQGVIYQQTPASGRSIKAGKDVSVMVSDGPRLLPVPDLSQMTLTRARGALQDADLPVGSLSYQFDDIVPKGIVTSQIPAAGSKVQHDTAVNLTVSSGPPPPPVPDGLSATCTIPGEIDVSWNTVTVPDATYNVYRDGTKIASSLPQTTYSDVGITDSNSHRYTVSAVDSNGESAQSKPVAAIAQQAPPPDATPDQTTAGALQATPDVTAPPSVASVPDAQKQRQFGIRFRVPRTGGDRHNVQIEVQDTTGTNIVYDEDRYGGDVVDETFTAFGNKVIFRIFIDGKLIKQQTK